MTNEQKAENMTKGFLKEGLIKKSRLQELLIKAMDWKDKQYAKEMQGEEIVTEIVNDWTYGKDPDHTVIPAIHQRINNFKIGNKVLIKITKQ